MPIRYEGQTGPLITESKETAVTKLKPVTQPATEPQPTESSPTSTPSTVRYEGQTGPLITESKETAVTKIEQAPQPELTEKQQVAVQAMLNAPEGYKVSTITPVETSEVPVTGGRERPTGTAYVVQYEAIQKPPPSIGEQIASFSPFNFAIGIAEEIVGKKATPNQQELFSKVEKTLGSGIPGIEGKPTEFIGGVVSAIEAPVYQVGSAFGVEDLPQPLTASSAIVGSVLGGGQSPEYLDLEATRSPAYIAGSLAGDIMILSAGAKGTQLIFKGASKITPIIASPTASGMVARAGLSAGLGGATAGVLSGGDPTAIAEGAVIGAGLSVGVELGFKAVNYVRGKLPTRLGGYKRLSEGQKVVGMSGEEVPTYISEPIKDLGGKRLELVADVTKNPIGTGDVTLNTMIDDYVNQNVPTAHATLSPERFELKVGGKTVLKGIPSEGAGFRASKELFHFYSAPGSDEFVTIYGGYVGVGEGYSETPRIIFGGHPSALVTTETVVSSEFLRQAGESVDDYLARTSALSGKTGIAQETILGASGERQLITPAKYVRGGEELPGSMFVSEGKVGTFQVVKKPTGVVAKVPVVRNIFSEYTNITVFKGSFAPTLGAEASPKVLNLQSYSGSYGKVISLPSLITVASEVPVVLIKPKTEPTTIKSEIKIPSKPQPTKISSPIKNNSKLIPPTTPIPSRPLQPSIPSPKTGSVVRASLSSKTSYQSQLSKASSPVSVPKQPSRPSLLSKSSSTSDIGSRVMRSDRRAIPQISEELTRGSPPTVLGPKVPMPNVLPFKKKKEKKPKYVDEIFGSKKRKYAIYSPEEFVKGVK